MPLARWQLSLLLSFCCVAQACQHLRSLTVPVGREVYVGAQSKHQKLWLFLPGIGDTHQDFHDRGWVELLLERYPDFDVMTVDLHPNYYWNRKVVERMLEDVIQPAQVQGYSHIVVSGNSIGGFGSLLSAQNTSQPVQGLVLMAPYLGLGNFAEFIDLPKEQWPTQDVGPAQWLVSTSTTPHVVLYGKQDKLAEAIEKLRKLDSQGRYYSMPGGHKWVTWTALFKRVLAEGRLDEVAGKVSSETVQILKEQSSVEY